MRGNTAFRTDYAVSEVVAAMLMVVLAVISFAVIQSYLMPDNPEQKIDATIIGSVNFDGSVLLNHIGGETLVNYKIIVDASNGSRLGQKLYTNDNWAIGQSRDPLENITDMKLTNDSIWVRIAVYTKNDYGAEAPIFLWDAYGPTEPIPPGELLLFSSLKQDSTDEDLICFNYTIEPNMTATSYIYNWIVNGEPFADVLMPFNSNNLTDAKDYSGNGNNAEVNGVEWTDDGVVGGAYKFDGSNSYLTMPLPDAFSDIKNNDFTISIWLKSDDITSSNQVVLEASYDNKNFIKIFLDNSSINAGLVWDEGTRHETSARTENLSSNTWYHIAVTWDSDDKLLNIYCNGTSSDLEGSSTFSMGAQNGQLDLGHGSSSSKYWDGAMDEFEVYNRVLTQEQIYQMYLQSKNGDSSQSVISASLTNYGDDWYCVITPNDGTQDDTPIVTNTITIVGCYGGY